ncbi:MAG: L-threonylcarbamoyladenylate synthase [Actinomycetota bacterium]|nr:L-threonylcarbamoyladenylate synthase [Actinomycetota bacterium]
MKTELIRVDAHSPDKSIIGRAAELIREGKLVAFPTETVYGLGANALDSNAVGGIFEVKGRSFSKPLAVCISNFKQLNLIVREVTPIAKKLMEKFWPGPLTLILLKAGIIPSSVTCGAETLGIRFPDNRIALEVIECANTPIALTSANLSGHPSPRTAQEVLADLGGRIDLILDGGPTRIGVVSTVLDLTIMPPRILRKGAIDVQGINEVLKEAGFERQENSH